MKVNKEGYVNSKVQNGIGEIEFYHPASNSLPSDILNDLAHAINDIGIDVRVNVIVLKSSGERAFCAGASFDELIAINDEATGKAFFNGFANVINAMRKCHKLIVTRVQGKAVGGGVGLIAASDYVIALDSASVKLSELAVGIGPFVVGPAVERKTGVSAFSELTIDASNWRSADWARKHGLYAEIYSDMPNVDEAISRIAGRLSKSNPEATLQLKKIFWEGTENWDTLLSERARISGQLVLSEFTKNAIAAFKKKDE